MTKRRVMTYGRKWDWDKYVPVEAGEGTFVQFGTDFAETRDGTSQYTSAIVEMPDGRVRNMPLHMIRFLDVEDK